MSKLVKVRVKAGQKHSQGAGRLRSMYREGDVLEVPERTYHACADKFEIVGEEKTPTPPPAAEEPEDANAEAELKKLTVKQLKAYAGSQGIDVWGVSKKRDIIDVILAATE